MAASLIAELVAIGDQSAATWSRSPEVGGAPGFEGIQCTYSVPSACSYWIVDFLLLFLGFVPLLVQLTEKTGPAIV